jgi:hypothetical protein
MRDTWLVLLAMFLVLGGTIAGAMYFKRYDEFGSLEHYLLGLACLLLFIMGGGIWKHVIQERERDRYSHLSPSDRI